MVTLLINGKPANKMLKAELFAEVLQMYNLGHAHDLINALDTVFIEAWKRGEDFGRECYATERNVLTDPELRHVTA